MPRSSLPRLLGCTLVLTVVIFAVFAQSLQHQFVDWDDRNEIFGNEHFNPVTVQSLAWNWSHTQLTLYMPVTYMVWGAVAAVAPRDSSGVLDPAAFHLLSVVLHLICSVLVFLLLRQLWRYDLPALAGALVFATHPLQVEAVAWASGMYTLLSTALCLTALIAYVAHVNRTPAPGVARRMPWLYLVATLLYVIALLCKAASVSLPVVTAVVDFVILGRPLAKVVRSLLPWLILAIPVVLLAKSFQDLTNVPAPAAWLRPLVAVDALGFYVTKLAFPSGLIPDYGRTPDWVLTHWRSLCGTAGIAVFVLCVAYVARFRMKSVTAGVGVLAAGLFPYLGLTTFDFQYVSTVADRYAYFGMVGVAILVCGAATHDRRAAFVALSLSVVFAVASEKQSRWWSDTDMLFNHTLAVNPRSLISHNVLGYQAAHSGRPVEAEQWYQGALAIWPADATIWFNLGNLHVDQNPARAAAEYRQAVNYLPANPSFHKNLAAALARSGDPAGAVEQYRAAIRLDPSDVGTHYGLASLLEGFGDTSGARSEYHAVLRLNPDHSGAKASLRRLASPA